MTTASPARFDATELERFATLLLRHAGLDHDKAGANAYMVSPVDPATLVATLDQLIQERPLAMH